MGAVRVRPAGWAAVLVLSAVACSDVPTSPAPVPEAVPSPVFDDDGAHRRLEPWLRDLLGDGGGRSSRTRLFVGAGDIAECYEGTPPPLPDAQTAALESPAEETAKLLDQIPGTVFTAGDNAYKFGTPFDFEACYDPTWGRHKRRTRPTAGNHEYITPGAAGHFAYFGRRSRPPTGYYSFSAENWHFVALNSTPQVYLCYPPEGAEGEEELKEQFGLGQLPVEPFNAATGRLCAGDVAQQAWLIADLNRHRGFRCTLVFYHHPRFSSGQHGNHYQMQRIWDILYAKGVDVVVTGHDHNYERFAPQDHEGNLDNTFGIRQFVVGTGGAHLREVDESTPEPNSEVIIEGKFGVILFALDRNGYRWWLIGTDKTILDSGSGTCHGRPPAGTVPLPTLGG